MTLGRAADQETAGAAGLEIETDQRRMPREYGGQAEESQEP